MARFPHLTIEESEPGSSKYVLTSTDFDLYSGTFDLCGKDGGGYDWQSVAEFLLRTSSRKLSNSNSISFDSEASMFCALSDDHSALEQLAELLCQTFRSKRSLTAAIRKSDSRESTKRNKRSTFSTVVVIHFDCYLYYDQQPLIDALKSNLPKEHVLVYYPSGWGETTFYLRTNDADDAILKVKPLLSLGLLKAAIIACAPRASHDYSVVWPRKRKSPLLPKNELCATVR